MLNKNILITGGTGFLGSHVVEKLLEKGSKIFATYRSLNSQQYFYKKKFNEKVVMVNCDIKDFKRVADIISKYEIDYIFHFAAQPIVDVAYKHPYETLMSNIIGTANILEASRLCNTLKGILIFTSDKAYGKTGKLPYYEDSPLKGDHPYDCSKSCADLIAQTYYKTYGIPLVIVRSGNIFGPGDLNFNRIIPGVIKSILNKEPLQIRSDGKMIRDYVYVKDVANACVLLIENIDKLKGEAFNIGGRNIYNVLELISIIEKILNQEVKKDILNIAKNEIPEQHLNYDKIKSMLGWDNEIDLNHAIKETFEWYSKYLNKNGD